MPVRQSLLKLIVSSVFRGLALALLPFLAGVANAASGDAQTAWRLLDYIAVDYAGAVAGGEVVSAVEYAEMREFSESVGDRLEALPDRPARPKLIAGSRGLKAAIERKADPAEVALLARSLGTELLRSYPVPMGPRQVPDEALGAQLFAQNCVSCHGTNGESRTPVARTLDPPPIDFTDRTRAAERTPFALYQVIDQGLEGTAMTSFSTLSAAEKWALAFHVGRFAYPETLAAQGKAIWDNDPALRRRIAGLEALSGLSEKSLAAEVRPGEAAAVIAFLRSNPEAAVTQPSTLALGRLRLQQSLTAYVAGDRARARELALSAYLDGFEPVEPMLNARNPALVASVEGAMAELRAAIARGRPADEVRERTAAINSLFFEADSALAPDQTSAASAFAGAFAVLLREGLEALLIVVAMLAFLAKADRRDMTRPVHYGWISALVAGVLTWWAATRLIGISGASRELTEGFGSLLAAAVLLFVGIWMHGKAQAGEWQRYIREQLGDALSRGSGWFLFALAFIAVYREVFETILFFAAMAAQGEARALVGGALAGAVVLTVIAVAMLRFSKRLEIGKFFAFSSALVAVLALVLAGKGVSALQEAGLIGVSPLGGFPRVAMLGLYPTVEGVAAQFMTLLILVLGFASNRRKNRLLEAA